MRTTFIVMLALSSAACGTVCNHIDAAEQGINEKAKPCNGTTKGTRDVNKCNAGLSSCSPDDLKALGDYADCLDRQPTCQPSTSLSWSLAVAGCSQPLFSVSGQCLNAIN